MNKPHLSLPASMTTAALAALLALAGCGGGSDSSGIPFGTSTNASAPMDRTGTPVALDGPRALPGIPTAGQMVAVPGAAITAVNRLSPRTIELTIRTDSFTAPVKVEVVLPVGYETDSKRLWAFTFYLGGTNHNQTTFRKDYGAEDLTESYPSLVVGPSGDAGYWSDWFNSGAGGPPKYETFVMNQLLPLIEANFRTFGDRAHRAIMGESMGGFGATMIAARHPDKFAAAASLSGTVDINFPTGMAAVSASSTAQTAGPAAPDAIYGPHLTQEVRWRGHNPWDLARNLGGLDLLVITGNGTHSPADGETPPETAGCGLEAGAIYPESVNLHDQLASLGIPHAWEPLAWGCHSTALFRYEIKRAVARFQKVFADSPAPPATFDFRAIEPSFSVYGWTVTADAARALEFMELRGVGPGGLTVIGSGKTTVTSPAVYRGVGSVDVTINGVTTSAKPDATGRISFPVDLGLANTQQAYVLGSVNNTQTRRVTLTPR